MMLAWLASYTKATPSRGNGLRVRIVNTDDGAPPLYEERRHSSVVPFQLRLQTCGAKTMSRICRIISLSGVSLNVRL
jgi:hypothetical protein